MSSSEEVEMPKKLQQNENSGKNDKKRSKSLRRAAAKEDSSSDEGVEDKIPIKKAKMSGEIQAITNKDGQEMFELGSMRYVTVRDFRGKALVDIREFYIDKASGEMRPGKKGISLNKEQYQNFKTTMRIKRESPSLDDGNSSMHSGGDGMRTVKQELTPSVDSPLGHLDPSKITNMVVDQVGLGGGPGSSHDGFVVPGPPHVRCASIFMFYKAASYIHISKLLYWIF
uniref:PC4 domain-containing protein n=1 Tax=Heterorhabditis bacteriophora TaxID=37862 RepID=A0A1I7XD39_HETBA